MAWMSRFVGATEASRQLGVQRSTLYAYVSRGLIERRVAVDGRTSLYSVDDLDTLAARTRRRDTEARPSLDVQIVTGITTLDERGIRYRGHDVADLARTASYERVAELLWTGELPAEAAWPQPTDADVHVARRAAAAMRVGSAGSIPAIASVMLALGARHEADDAPAAVRRVLGVLPDVFRASAPRTGSLAERLAAAWRPADADLLAGPVQRALVLLADHELATSTIAVRLAGSVRTGAYDALTTGLTVLQGQLHGGASPAVNRFLVECEQRGAATVIGRRLTAGERIPGFGHKVYAGDDPRLSPLLEAVALLPDPDGRSAVLDDVIAQAGVRLTTGPNVDLGLGALTFVAELPAELPLFAIARLAGFAAHFSEELGERPVRYRGIARAPS